MTDAAQLLMGFVDAVGLFLAGVDSHQPDKANGGEEAGCWEFAELQWIPDIPPSDGVYHGVY